MANSGWSQLFMSGAAASRPLVVDYDGEAIGALYYATDTGVISVYVNGAWRVFPGMTVGKVSLGSVAFASLPSSPSAGDMAYCNDLSDGTVGATAAGGGTAKGVVVYDGTNWIVGGAAAPA